MKVLKKIIKPFLLFSTLFVKHCIVFESVPDFSDNTRCVYDELKKRGYDKKYYFIWQTDSNKIAILYESEWVIYHPHTFKQLLMSISFKFKRKCNVFCNRCFSKINRENLIFYLCHGTPIKSVREYYDLPEYVDYVITTSDLSTEISAYEYKVPKSKCVPIGYPRNDYLINPNVSIDVKKLFKIECKKVIVWYPTYRQNKNNNMHVSEATLPVVSDEETVYKLNDYANELGILIVVKPHFAQDLSYFNFSDLSNIKRIDDSFFTENNLTSYEFVGACDALLTDYSSIYYDYTLCNKPIGLIWQDYEEYRTNPGFIKDYERLTLGGEKIYCLNDLCSFLKEVSEGTDKLQKIRNNICKEMNNVTDNTITKKVTDFIINKSNL